MATTNIWKTFTSLLPDNARTVVTIVSRNGNGTSTIELRNGTRLIMNGETVSEGFKALVENNTVLRQVPNLEYVQRNI